LVRYQDEDGSWTWTAAPAKNRPPPVMESDEIATLLAAISLENRRPKDRATADPVGNALEKAAAYLAKTPDGDTTQAAALRLYYALRTGAGKKEREAKIEALLKRQPPDGGWAQTPQLYSDAYATGQALYFLSLAGRKANRADIKRGISFLALTQRTDGSWRVVPRAHPGERPFTHAEPIGSFGTSWATMALMRLVPPK
jgi:squalene cyclase